MSTVVERMPARMNGLNARDDILTSEGPSSYLVLAASGPFATDPGASRRVESYHSRYCSLLNVERHLPRTCVSRFSGISSAVRRIERARQVPIAPSSAMRGELLAYKSRIPIRGRKYFEVSGRGQEGDNVGFVRNGRGRGDLCSAARSEIRNAGEEEEEAARRIGGRTAGRRGKGSGQVVGEKNIHARGDAEFSFSRR